jgi:hypothetical protein
VPTPDPTPVWVLTLVRQQVEYPEQPVADLSDPARAPRITYRDEGRIALPHARIQSVQDFDAETFQVNGWHVRGSWREFVAFFAGDVNRIYHFPPPGDGYVAEDLPVGPPPPDGVEDDGAR